MNDQHFQLAYALLAVYAGAVLALIGLALIFFRVKPTLDVKSQSDRKLDQDFDSHGKHQVDGSSRCKVRELEIKERAILLSFSQPALSPTEIAGQLYSQGVITLKEVDLVVNTVAEYSN